MEVHDHPLQRDQPPSGGGPRRHPRLDALADGAVLFQEGAVYPLAAMRVTRSGDDLASDPNSTRVEVDYPVPGVLRDHANE